MLNISGSRVALRLPAKTALLLTSTNFNTLNWTILNVISYNYSKLRDNAALKVKIIAFDV